MTITRELKEEVIRLSNEGKGRNEIARLLTGQISEGSVGNIVRAARRQTTFPNTHDGNDAYKRKQASTDVNTGGQIKSPKRQGPPADKKEPNPIFQQQDTSSKYTDYNLIPTTSPRPSTTGTGKAVILDKTNSGPLSWLGIDFITNKEPSTGSKYSDINMEFDDIINNEQQNETTQTEKEDRPILSTYSIKDQGPSVVFSAQSPQQLAPRFVQDEIERELRIEGGKAWEYYGAAQKRILSQIAKAKDQRRHQLFLIDCKEKKLEEMTKRLEQIQHDLATRESNLKDREAKVFEAEPFLGVAKELKNLGIDMGLVLDIIRKRAEVENLDIRTCATNLSQELMQYTTLQKKIERASQELELINMSSMKKQEALTLLTDLSNKGVTESQILGLIKFAAEWEATNGKSGPGNNNGYGHLNGYDSNLSKTDQIRLNLLGNHTTNMLNRIHCR